MSRELDQITSRGHFQPQPFCNSVNEGGVIEKLFLWVVFTRTHYFLRGNRKSYLEVLEVKEKIQL